MAQWDSSTSWSSSDNGWKCRALATFSTKCNNDFPPIDSLWFRGQSKTDDTYIKLCSGSQLFQFLHSSDHPQCPFFAVTNQHSILWESVPTYYLAKPQARDRSWDNQRGKQTLLSLTPEFLIYGCPLWHLICTEDIVRPEFSWGGRSVNWWCRCFQHPSVTFFAFTNQHSFLWKSVPAKPQPRERSWDNQQGKKTLLSLTLVRLCEMT